MINVRVSKATKFLVVCTLTFVTYGETFKICKTLLII